MSSSENRKRFSDPLFDKLDRGGSSRGRAGKSAPPPARRNVEPPRQAPAPPGGPGGGLRNALLGVIVVLIAALGYFLFQAQGQITDLNAQLTTNEEQLSEVSEDLASSQEELTRINTGLDQSESRLHRQGQDLERYKGLYESLKDNQEHQNLELQALNLEKASQSDVAALRDQAQQLQTGVEQASGQITELQGTTARNAGRIEETGRRLDETGARLEQVETSSRDNAVEIAAVRRSMESDYYNFELQEKGAYMKVQEVSFRLTDIDFKKRLYDLDVLSDGKVIRQRDKAINEPIYFFREGQKRPYEVVVTRIDRDLVVGYLAVPKT